MTRRLPLLARALPLLLLVLLALPAPARAHANYVRSEPASGVATPAPPGEIRI